MKKAGALVGIVVALVLVGVALYALYSSGCHGRKTVGTTSTSAETDEVPAGTGTQTPSTSTGSPPPAPTAATAATQVTLSNGIVSLDAQVLNDGNAHFYNVLLLAGPGLPDKMIRFFVLKDGTGVYRAAADACQVCYLEKKGYHQKGAFMVCNNCGNTYPFEKIATEKGGCNPGPVNPNLHVVDGKISINQQELQNVAGLF